jgi:hypothetical protein
MQFEMYEGCLINKVPHVIQTDWEIITMLSVTHLFHCTIIIVQQSPWAHRWFFSIFTRVQKFHSAHEFLFSSHVNIVISCSNYKLYFIKKWPYFILCVLPNSKQCNSQLSLYKIGIPLEEVLVLCLLLICWCLANCCSHGQCKKRTPVKFIYIFKIFSVIFHFNFYCMLILVVTLAANWLAFNYIIIRRRTNISASHIRDYSIHGKYSEEDCCSFKIFLKFWMWYFSLLLLSHVNLCCDLAVDRVQALVSMVVNHVLYRVRNS